MPEASLGAYMALWLLQQSLVLTSMERVTLQSPPQCLLLPQPGTEPALMTLHLQQS